MKDPWNWIDFFNQNVHPPFVIELNGQYEQLIDLPFEQGLGVIITSVPTFDHHQWRYFHDQLAGQDKKYVDYWLLLGQLIRDYLDDVRKLLQQGVEYALSQIQRLLTQLDAIRQFAVMSCLHHCAKTNVQARMLFQYLLNSGKTPDQPMNQMLNFYQNLTERQKDVAVLTAHGFTNQEIAATLHIESCVVAEHLTNIFNQFQLVIQYSPDKHGTRYRMIHLLTHLFIQHPYLLLDRTL